MIEIYTRKDEAQDDEDHSLWGVVALALAVLALAVLASSPAVAAEQQQAGVKRAAFAKVAASPDVRKIADWVVDSSDNKDLPFAIIDKKNARIFVFEPNGHVKGAAPVLLGLAKGDHTVPGIGSKEYSEMRPEDRTTPAGRFSIERGPNEHGVNVVWLDYESALSLHPVVKGTPKERRAARLSSPTAADNRISFGCINAPTAFFTKIIDPTFKEARGIIYVLPETKPLQQVFNTQDVGKGALRTAAITVTTVPAKAAAAGAPAATPATAAPMATVATAAAALPAPAASAVPATPAAVLPAGDAHVAGGFLPAASVVKE
jgi:hypothetical protein